jgi:hypothetical protein
MMAGCAASSLHFQLRRTTMPTTIDGQQQALPSAMSKTGVIKLQSWKGDYLHRPDSPQGVTTWNTGIGNEWIIEVVAGNKIQLRSWKGDYLHRPDSPQGVTTWNTGIGNEWTIEPVTRSLTVRFGQNFPASRSISTPYSEAGLTFTNNVGNKWAKPLINQFVGTVAVPSELTVTPSLLGIFTFQSLQVCNINTSISAQAIVFQGVRSDGSIVSASFSTPDNSAVPQTFAPTGFSNLKSLVVKLGFVGFDNLIFTPGS